MNFLETELNDTIKTYRKEWYKSLIGPLDGMWESLHIPSAATHLIQLKKKEIGYCCIDKDKSLLQLYLNKSNRHLTADAVKALIEADKITSALMSSIEIVSFNACLCHASRLEKDTYNYVYAAQNANIPQLELRAATSKDIDAAKAFFKSAADFDDHFGYGENLINRKELFLYEEGGSILASGECRLSDTQPQYADLGMIVQKSQRGKGLGTKMLNTLASLAESKKRIPICSTTVDNIGSQKAIAKAGFFRTHIIFRMELSFPNLSFGK